MTPRRSAQQPDPGTLSRGPGRQTGDGPPECSHPECTFVGWPTETHILYVACEGDRARHQRTPVGAA